MKQLGMRELTTDWRGDVSLLVLRVIFGFGMLYGHGFRKLDKLLAGGEIKFLDFMGLGAEWSLGLAVFAEVGAAALLMVGLGTRLAAFPLWFTMMVAVFVAHWGDPFADMEAGLMYGAVYLALMLMGGGRYSLDFVIWKRS